MLLKLSSRTVAYILFGIIAGSVVLHSLFQFLSITAFESQPIEFIERFNMDNEASIPTWFSQILLFIAAAILGYIAWFLRQTHESYTRHWTFLSLIFLYLSIDEGATLHEMTIMPMRQLFHNLPDFLYFAWVVPFGLAVVAIGIVYASFVYHLPKSIRRWVIMAGGLYLSGALIIEMFGGFILESGLPHTYYILATTLEETLEMLGVGVFIVALLKYMRIKNMQVKMQVTH